MEKGTHRFSLRKKRDSKNGNHPEKRVFFEMTGKYVKGEEKEGTEKRIIKSKRIFKKEMHFDKKEKPRKNKYSREQKWECPKNRQELTQKRKFGQRHRERTNVLKTHKFVKMSNKKVNTYIWNMQMLQEEFFEMKDKKRRYGS